RRDRKSVTESATSVTEPCGNRDRSTVGQSGRADDPMANSSTQSCALPSRLSVTILCHDISVTLALSRRLRRLAAAGFTLVELIVVLAIIALLLSLAVPRYFAHVQHAKEATLKQDLNIMRDAIDKFHGDRGRYPETIDELVTMRYLRNVPQDPITEST